MLKTQEILVERYQLLRVLGESASRQTWLAEDLVNKEQVVVKLLITSDQLQWENLRLFEREAKVLRHLDHPRIPQYYDDFVLERDIVSFALVQEYIPAKSLKELLASGKTFTETEVRDIAIAVLKILIYLHKLSPPVLHRDIKPSNLLFDESKTRNQIYLVDFGAVQDRAAAEGATFTVVGTYGYAPLEQFGGRATPASDLYALGATLIHLATGIPPADLPQFDSKMQFAHLTKLNPGFVRWLQLLTEPNLEKRFQTASAALEALQINQLAITNGNLETPLTPISVRKSSDKLAIHIPSLNKNPVGLIVGGVGLVVWFILWKYVIASVTYSLTTFPIFAWVYIWLIMGVLLTAWWTLPRYIETYIDFDNQNFEIKWKLFGFTVKNQLGKVLDIDKVYNSKGSYQNQKRIHEVILSLGVNEYYISRFKQSLSQEESRYLASTIRDWLGI
ncbi:serine/threonine protein kinase [Dulcicalothrix desertica PCC 7102]|uniref:Serine/threonine protein kinase n=1 Tax=Dulcicalothrix desertica PCC 7102 TaxID=232991 RepID=A0A433VIV3_9CYAN|nr:serine/threonine-protein kinase [Dulcicalothrix desertica]RUT06009.1 serine/threonine protein kinase [Dulcicalothrix desertica PCC 7102]TWH54325.1 serine/threonine protein kinase [Dulcicalothrix desertica PCC 7102]